MISQMRFSLRMRLLRVSPFTQFQRSILRYKRYRSLTQVVQQQLFTLKFEHQNLVNRLGKYSAEWKNLQEKLVKVSAKINQSKFLDQQISTSEQAIKNDLENLISIQNPEQKVEALESLISRIKQLEEQNTDSSIIQSKSPYLLNYKEFLAIYTEKTAAEFEFWKVQDQIETIQTKQEKLEEKLDRLEQKYGSLWSIWRLLGN